MGMKFFQRVQLLAEVRDGGQARGPGVKLEDNWWVGIVRNLLAPA